MQKKTWYLAEFVFSTITAISFGYIYLTILADAGLVLGGAIGWTAILIATMYIIGLVRYQIFCYKRWKGEQ